MQLTYKETLRRISANLSPETLQARREWHDISKVVKGKNLHQEYYTQQSSHSNLTRPRRPAPAARRPLPRAGDGEVRAPSPKECAWESAPVRAQQPRPRCGFASTLRLPGTLPPPTLRSTLLAPRLQPGCLSNSPAGASHARLTVRCAASSPSTGSLLPTLRSSRPGAWLRTRKTGLRGRLGPRGTCHPPGVSSPPSFVCAPPAPPRSAFHAAALRANAKERKSAGQPGDWEGGKRRQHSLWEGSGMVLPLGASRSRPYPGFSAPPGPGQRGTGEERSHGDRVGNGASGAAGKGVKHCFGFAKES